MVLNVYFWQVNYQMVDNLWRHLCDIFSTILQYGYPIYFAFGVWFKTFIFNKSIIKWWTIYGAISVTFYQPFYSTVIQLFSILGFGKTKKHNILLIYLPFYV